MALFMCGKSSRDWSQTSLILSLSMIVGEELTLYVILVLVDWAPLSTIALDYYDWKIYSITNKSTIKLYKYSYIYIITKK